MLPVWESHMSSQETKMNVHYRMLFLALKNQAREGGGVCWDPFFINKTLNQILPAAALFLDIYEPERTLKKLWGPRVNRWASSEKKTYHMTREVIIAFMQELLRQMGPEHHLNRVTFQNRIAFDLKKKLKWGPHVLSRWCGLFVVKTGIYQQKGKEQPRVWFI